MPKGAYAPDIIVLLTDGASNAGPMPLDAAQQAVDRGVRVYTIGFGTARGSEMPNCNPGVQGREPQFGGGARSSAAAAARRSAVAASGAGSTRRH